MCWLTEQLCETQLVKGWQMVTLPMQKPNCCQKAQTWVHLDVPTDAAFWVECDESSGPMLVVAGGTGELSKLCSAVLNRLNALQVVDVHWS